MNLRKMKCWRKKDLLKIIHYRKQIIKRAKKKKKNADNIVKLKEIEAKKKILTITLTLLRMVFFGAAHG